MIRKILLLPSSHLLSSLDSRPVSKERTERGPKEGRGVLANTIYLDNDNKIESKAVSNDETRSLLIESKTLIVPGRLDSKSQHV